MPDNNISKAQPSKAKGLGGVFPLRSKNAALLYMYRICFMTWKSILNNHQSSAIFGKIIFSNINELFLRSMEMIMTFMSSNLLLLLLFERPNLHLLVIKLTCTYFYFQRMHFLLLLVLLSIFTVSKSSVYVVTGGSRGNYDGVYEQRRRPIVHFKKIGKPDHNGKAWFLYPDNTVPPTWMIGQGNNVLSAKAFFRSSERSEVAPVSSWLHVDNGGQRGQDWEDGMGWEGFPSTGVRVTR